MSNPHVSMRKWQEIVEGFEITGVAIRNRDILQFVGRKSLPHEELTHLLDGDIPTRIFSIFLDDTSDQNIECQELLNMAYPKLGVSRVPFERPGGIVVSMGRDGDTWPLGGGNGPLEKIAAGARPATQRLKCLFGFTYSVGLGRRIYRRDAVGSWSRIEGIPMSTDEDELQAAGFGDIDAFSPSDIYAVGGHGDVWHFNGQEWRQMGFPTNEQLATVTCAGDGNVYVTSKRGSLWVGQHSTWRLLEKRESSILWNDVRWFDGQLWLASDYQLRVWNGKEIVPPEHEGGTILASGYMDAHDGLLVVADLWSVSTFDGKTWRKVVAPYEGLSERRSPRMHGTAQDSMMDPVLNRSAWEDVYKGYEITGVAIRDRDTIQTLARKAVTPEEGSHLADHQIPRRVASIFLSDPEDDNVGFRELHGFGYPRLGVSREPFTRPGAVVAMANADGDAWPFGGGDGPLEKIAAGQWPGVSRLRCLSGFTYAVGTAREIHKRVAVGEWQRIEGFPEVTDETALRGTGFRDLDAFSETDMYAVGGHGDVWHFNGQEWRQMGFPTDEQLATVTCAGDGNVYVTGEGGSLWVWQHSTWRLLEKRESSVLWNDVRWFNGQLWLASDYQLRVWNGQDIVPPEHEGGTILASGHMDAHDGLLVVADLWSVSTFDGKTWRKVVAPYKN